MARKKPEGSTMANYAETLPSRRTVELDDELLHDIRELIHEDALSRDEGQPATSAVHGGLLNILVDLHAADIADLLENLEEDDRQHVFSLLTPDIASDVLTELDESLRETLLESISTEGITKIVGELESDDAADIIQDLRDDVATEVLDKIEEGDAASVYQLLRYPEDSAGGIMATEVLTSFTTDTVKGAIRKTRQFVKEGILPLNIYVTDDEGMLKGFLPVGQLILLGPGRRMGNVMNPEVIAVPAEMDQEEVANIIRKYDLVSVPVVNKEGKLIGRITVDDIMDVVQEEVEEDIERMAGLAGTEELATSVFGISRIRLPWLLLGFCGEILSAMVLKNFQASIEEIIAAAFFIPIIMAMGGNAGIQSSAIVVRGLATGDVRLGGTAKRLSKEFSIATVNGVVLSLLVFAVSYIWFGDLRFGITVGLALMVVVLNATVVGASIPLVLERLKIDPAIATGPFITTTNDALGLLIYFGIMSLVYA